MDKTDLELRLKWYGMFWRPKTPGKFTLRLRIPNGILNSKQLKVISSIVARYGENGSCDITTRQNIQLRGILISDLPDILNRLEKVNISTIQSGFDNPTNDFREEIVIKTLTIIQRRESLDICHAIRDIIKKGSDKSAYFGLMALGSIGSEVSKNTLLDLAQNLKNSQRKELAKKQLNLDI